MLESKKALVTGGAGFVGSHLVDRLVEDNDVTVVDDFSTGEREFLNSKAELVEGSLLELHLEGVVEGGHLSSSRFC